MSISRMAAALGGLVLFASSVGAAQESPAGRLAGRFAAGGGGSTYGAIYGTVQDEQGAPLVGAIVSAVGVTQTVVLTDKQGRFEFRTLSSGPYLIRAHLSGFVAPSGEMVHVRAGGRTSSAIAMRRVGSRVVASAAPSRASSTPPSSGAPILAAGIAVPVPEQPQPPTPDAASSDSTTSPSTDDDHSELAWRLRHLRRSVLQDVDSPAALLLDDSAHGDSDAFGSPGGFGRTMGAPARLASNLFSSAPLSGELNFLTTSSFDSPQQLFGSDMLSRSVAYMSVGSPAGSRADWAVRGALSQADISAWVIAGTYSSRGPAGHHYDIGLSYATQRYDGGNPAALRNVTDGSRNAGAVYGFDSFTLSPAISIAYGARYARYDYLEDKALVSPRVAVTLSAGDHFRVNGVASRRATAPGAEEFLPPGDTGLWLPPQRTFSSLSPGGALEGQATTHYAVEMERDLGAFSVVSVGAFRQEIADQLITMFGLELPGQPAATMGHYFVGDFGNVGARGMTAAFRTGLANRIQGSVEYSFARADWTGGDQLGFWLRRLPSASAMRPNRVQGISTSIVTNVPETSTHVVVLYRVSNAVEYTGKRPDSSLDSRFDVQVRQSLPFLDFSSAKWEMLVGVRNFFREAAPDQSVFDELLVIRPPKRIVGGLTMRF